MTSHSFKSIPEGLLLPQKCDGNIDIWQETEFLVLSSWLAYSASSEDYKLLQEKHNQCLGPPLNMLLEFNNVRQE